MRRVTVALAGREYRIHIGGGGLARLAEVVAPLQPTALLVVTDSTVDTLYGTAAERALAPVARTARVTLPAGEAHKTWDAVARVQDALVAHGADRRSVVVALGGGVVGDVAGFAAAVFMRGIRFVQVPTTLLAQVDSSVGGKTGINHASGKNLIGAFHQPAAVVTDTDTLATLPAREVSAGLAEILKHGLLADAVYFESVCAALARLRALEPQPLADAIGGSCEIKAAIVGRDERESGERALLNLGHTFGHAIEALAGYGTWLHGEAVGCGLVLAADLSRRLGLIDGAAVDRVRVAVAAAGLPVRIDGLSLDGALAAMRGDKKSEAGTIRFVLLERIGKAVMGTAPDALVRATLADGGFR